MPEPTNLADRLDRLNPFSRGKAKTRDEDDAGDAMDASAMAGGGHAFHAAEATKHHLRVSNALKRFLVRENVLAEHDAAIDADRPSAPLAAILDKPHVRVPPAVVDRSHPLPDYYVSSSHNTYLMAHQLYGTSSVDAYRSALRAGSRCVEIDAWDHDENPDEPKVTHGFTLVSNIPFRKVCETVRDVLDEEIDEAAKLQRQPPAPILLSLENHCKDHGQKRLVEIMTEVLGHRLLSEPIQKDNEGIEYDPTTHVKLGDLSGKVAVIVEYHLPDEATDSESSSESSNSDSDEEEKAARKTYEDRKENETSSVIIPELAALGVYAQSVKPGDNSWFDPGELVNAPHHQLINISESALRTHIPWESTKIAAHNARHLMRVYPKGTRISSKNLKQVPFWGIGAQICALNWQRFDAAMQVNEAMFDGTDGYVLKPAALRTGGSGSPTTGKRKRLRLRVAGATDVPVAEEAKDFRPYLTCVLVHPWDLENEPPKRKTRPYKQHRLEFLHRGENPPPEDPVWDEELEWEYDDSELVFLRMLIKSDESFARNPILGVSAVRLMYLVPGWSFITMLDLKGRETKCTLLVKFEVEDV
ncbi:hypothetical protein VUR80DRAFT_8628 [Thermomyces stellatus]